MGRRKDAVASDVWRRLVELVRSQRSTVAESAAVFGLTPGHVHALLSLDPDEPRTMRQLADAWRCDASNVTFLADRLEERGLVERQVSTVDRRVKTLRLTPAGRLARAGLEERGFHPPSALLALSAAELEDLDMLLGKVLTVLGHPGPGA